MSVLTILRRTTVWLSWIAHSACPLTGLLFYGRLLYNRRLPPQLEPRSLTIVH
jgi:hypothetical protein